MLSTPYSEGSWRPPPGTEVSFFRWGRYMHSPGVQAMGLQRQPEAEAAYSSTPRPILTSHRPLDIAVVTGDEVSDFYEPMEAQPDRIAVLGALPNADDPEQARHILHGVWLELGPQLETVIYDDLQKSFEQRYTSLSRALLVGEGCGLLVAATELWANSLQVTDATVVSMVAAAALEASRWRVRRRHQLARPEHEESWAPTSQLSASIALLEVYNSYIGLHE